MDFSKYLQGALTMLPGSAATIPLYNIAKGAISNPNQFMNTLSRIGSPAAPTPTPPPASLSMPRVVAPPKLDYAAIQTQARAQAENAVNPYYTSQLNKFLEQQSFQKQQQQAQTETNVKNLEDTLKNTLEGNTIQQGRTAEDVALNQANINQTADQFQTDTGQAADANRIAQARQIAQAGTTGGLGAQQQEATQIARNTGEKRQEQQFQQQRNTQELFKTRTFEDLARSGELATASTEKGKKQADFDLNNFMKNADFELENKKGQLEVQRLQAVGDEQSKQARLAYNQYLAKIKDPAQLALAGQIYGGGF